MAEKTMKDKWLDSTLQNRKREIEIDVIKGTTSQIQRKAIEFYKGLESMVEPNHFDSWSRKFKEESSTQSKIYEFLFDLAEILGALSEPAEFYDLSNNGIRNLAFDICVAYQKDPINVKNNVRTYINMKWNNLIETRRKYVDIIADDETKEMLLENINIASKTEIDKIAHTLNKVVFISDEVWECLIYSLLSTHAPAIKINDIDQRPNLHTNLIGEISTAKSKILNVLKQISPKYLNVTKTTEASFEGISKPKEIAQGVIESSYNGILLIPEFKRTLSKFQLLREAMDCDWLDITKRGITRRFKVNTSFVVASNPKDDFFPEMGRMRTAIPFEEGVLSRFDFVIPLIMDQTKNEEIVNKLKLFGGKMDEDEFRNIRLFFETLQDGMKMVKRVVIRPEHEEMLKTAYLEFNVQMGNRTLVILRDLETLCRLVNVIVASNFYNRIEVSKGIFEASEGDILKAIDLWNSLIYQRKQMYEVKDDKQIKSTTDILMEIIAEHGGNIKTNKLIDECKFSKASVYRYLKKLEEEGKIILENVHTASKSNIKIVEINENEE